jgi:hypothetical protein
MANTNLQAIARSFFRLGWIGIWIQAVLAILPLMMLAYYLFGMATGGGVSFGFVDYLAFFGLAILAFTTFWSYRYTRLAKRIADPDRKPSWTSVAKTLWVGIWASCAGIFVSVLLLMIEVIRLLFLLLKAPQGGVPVLRTEIESRTQWVSAIDVLTLLAELCTLVGELVIVVITLWLLLKITRSVDCFAPANSPDDSIAKTS